MLPGAGTHYIVNYSVRFQIKLQTNPYMSNYWAASEVSYSLVRSNSSPYLPGATYATTMADIGNFFFSWVLRRTGPRKRQWRNNVDWVVSNRCRLGILWQ